MKKKKSEELKREWKHKIHRELMRNEMRERNLIVKKLDSLEEILREKGLDTPKIRRLLEHTRRRFGISSANFDEIENQILKILNDNEGILSIKDLWRNLLKKGVEIDLHTLERILVNLSQKKIIYINQGVISNVRPADTALGRKILQIIRETGKISVQKLAKKMKISDAIMTTVLNDLAINGLIVIDEEHGEVIIV